MYSTFRKRFCLSSRNQNVIILASSKWCFLCKTLNTVQSLFLASPTSLSASSLRTMYHLSLSLSLSSPYINVGLTLCDQLLLSEPHSVCPITASTYSRTFEIKSKPRARSLFFQQQLITWDVCKFLHVLSISPFSPLSPLSYLFSLISLSLFSSLPVVFISPLSPLSLPFLHYLSPPFPFLSLFLHLLSSSLHLLSSPLPHLSLFSSPFSPCLLSPFLSLSPPSDIFN